MHEDNDLEISDCDSDSPRFSEQDSTTRQMALKLGQIDEYGNKLWKTNAWTQRVEIAVWWQEMNEHDGKWTDWIGIHLHHGTRHS